jgi:lysophospholipase L1-like esterase
LNRRATTLKKLLLLFALALLLSVAVIGVSLYDEMQRTASDDPLVWESAIAAFEEQDRVSAPPADATLFVGSSSIRLWHDLEQDMAPLVTLRRGFGGARMNDVVYYAERLINRYDPAQVVIYVGSNDINVSDTPMEAVPVIREGLRSLLRIIGEHRPGTPVFYIAITPSILSWDKREAVAAANRAAREVCDSHSDATFIATEDLFLTAEGMPDKKLYQFDGLHLSKDGYARWTSRIKPLLMPGGRVRPAGEI